MNNLSACGLHYKLKVKKIILNFQDLLMAMYLSQLTRVQAQLNEKLLMTSTLVNPNN